MSMSKDTNNSDKLGVIFGAYLSKVKGTFPLYFFTRRTTEGTLTYASLHPRPPIGTNINPANDTIETGLSWQPRFGARASQAPTVSPIYVMQNKPSGFSVESGICVPCSNSTTSIADCLQKLPGNIEDLSRRNVNLLDEEIGVPNASIYSISKETGEIARKIKARAVIDKRNKECPCPVDYRREFQKTQLEKKAFMSGLSLALCFCIMLIILVVVYIINRR